MAKYDVEHSCGHTQVHQLFGKHTDRDRKIEWLETQECTECWKKSKRAGGPKFLARKTQNGIELACYENSFDIKENLKARGWKFSRQVPNGKIGIAGVLALTASPVVAGWSTILSADQAEKEIKWILEQQYELRLEDVVTSLFKSVLEGRPDLILKNESNAQ
jgi:hypothetical protein